MAGTVFDPVEVVRALAHALQDGVQHVDVVLFAVRPDQVRLAQTSLRQDRPHGRGVVLCVDPVAHVQAVAVELRTDAGEHVGDLARDELLDVLARAVVVRTVRDGDAHSVGAEPRAHQHVGRRLVELYGLLGRYGVSSVKRAGSSNARSPYTSSVEM